MYKEVLRTMNSEAFMASLALIVFFTFFVLVLFDAWRKSREEVEHLEHLPLEGEEPDGVEATAGVSAGTPPVAHV
jgi:cbb3-type cytochrome oxidase subunit 3